MKKISFILTVLISFSFIFTSCNPDEIEPIDDNIMPENFKVDIPESLMSNGTKSLKSKKSDDLQGNDIYEHLTTFIHVGDEASEIVSDIIKAIRMYNLNQPMSFSFESEEDERAKNVIIVEKSTFEGKEWQYQMTITDADSEGNEDGGIGIQIFWDKNPVNGIAILKPYNINRNEIPYFSEAMFRIDYSETGASSYEQEMIVYISGLKTNIPHMDQYAMETLKMKVGKNGNTIEVYGNSNHPNAVLFSSDAGFNWAFVAAGSNVSEIGVAEVALPPSNLNSTDRQVILKDYSIKNVFTEEVNSWYMEIFGFLPDEQQLAVYLQNAEAPGYFNNNGFVQGGTSPGSEYDVFEAAINNLTPYNPSEVSSLTIAFKTE